MPGGRAGKFDWSKMTKFRRRTTVESGIIQWKNKYTTLIKTLNNTLNTTLNCISKFFRNVQHRRLESKVLKIWEFYRTFFKSHYNVFKYYAQAWRLILAPCAYGVRMFVRPFILFFFLIPCACLPNSFSRVYSTEQCCCPRPSYLLTFLPTCLPASLPPFYMFDSLAWCMCIVVAVATASFHCVYDMYACSPWILACRNHS